MSRSVIEFPSLLCLLVALFFLSLYLNFVIQNPNPFLPASLLESSIKYKNSWKILYREGKFDLLRRSISAARNHEAAQTISKASAGAENPRLGSWEISTFQINNSQRESLFDVKRIESSHLEQDRIIYYNVTNPEKVCVLYLHGGGWIFNSPKTYERLGRFIAEYSGFPVYIPNYRKAPEFPHPYALLDALRTLKYLSERYSKVILAGDSAGGNMAASLVNILYGKIDVPEVKDASQAWQTDRSWMNKIEIVCNILIYPALFYTPSNKEKYASYRGAHGHYSPIIDIDNTAEKWDVNTCKNETCGPDLSPYAGKMEFMAPLSVEYKEETYKNMPRTMVVVSDADVLRDEGVEYYENLMKATPARSNNSKDEKEAIEDAESKENTNNDGGTEEDSPPPMPVGTDAPIEKHSLLEVYSSFHGFLTNDFFPFYRKKQIVDRMVKWMHICLQNIEWEKVTVRHTYWSFKKKEEA